MKVVRTTDKEGKPLQLEKKDQGPSEEEIRRMMIRSYLESEGATEANTKSPGSIYPDIATFDGTLEAYKKEVARRREKFLGKVSLEKKNPNLKNTDPGYRSRHTDHTQPH